MVPREDANNDLKLHMAIAVDQRKHARPKNHAKHARLKLRRLAKESAKLEEEVTKHNEMSAVLGLAGADKPSGIAVSSKQQSMDIEMARLDANELKSDDDSAVSADSKRRLEAARNRLRERKGSFEVEVNTLFDDTNTFWGALKANHSYVGPFISYHPVYTRFERATILFAACVQTMFTSVLWYGNSNPDNIFEQAIIIGASAFIQGPITVLLLLVFGMDMQVAEQKLVDEHGDDEDGSSHDKRLEDMLHRTKGADIYLPEIGATLGYVITFFSAAVALYATNLFVVPMDDEMAMRWLNSQWSVNLVCIIIVEPMRCYLTWKLGQVRMGPQCVRCMVSMGCCCCCLENESAKLERAQKRAEENTDK